MHRALPLRRQSPRNPADAEEMHRLHVDGTRIALTLRGAPGCSAPVEHRAARIAVTSGIRKEIRDESAPPPIDLIGRWPYYRSKLYAEMAALERNDPPAL